MQRALTEIQAKLCKYPAWTGEGWNEESRKWLEKLWIETISRLIKGTPPSFRRRIYFFFRSRRKIAEIPIGARDRLEDGDDENAGDYRPASGDRNDGKNRKRRAEPGRGY